MLETTPLENQLKGVKKKRFQGEKRKEFRDITQKLIDLGLKLAGKEVNDYSNPPDAEYSDQLPVEEINIEEEDE